MVEAEYCVVGAGFAGLTAALRLKQAGHSVALVEARDRIGGRTFTQVRDDGSWIDHGGAWVAPTQQRIHALMTEFGVPTYNQYADGDAMMVFDGKQHLYRGTIDWTTGSWAALKLGAAFLELGQMSKSIPIEAPWEAENADEWDRISLAEWLDNNVASKPAQDLLVTAIAGPFSSAPSEVSMLFVLYQMASGSGPSFTVGVKDAAHDARPVGGMGAIHRRIAAELGDTIHLAHPVRRIAQHAEGVTLDSDGSTVRARRAIVAVPIAIASQIDYEPMLPADRSFLHQRMPSGSVMKIAVVYDEPFWRAGGLSGQSVAPGTAAPVTLDACTDTGRPGILAVIVEGPIARHLGQLDEGARRNAVVDALVERFGAKARAPVDYIEQVWSTQRYSGGGMFSHAPTGVLTQFGHALRAPCGRIHWAGTESSAVMCGWIDGAIRSGERAASEVMAAEMQPEVSNR